MRMIIGIIFSIIGIYFISQGKGLEKPIGFGMVGFGIILLPGGSEPMAGVVVGIVVIVIAVVWGVIYSQNEKDGTNARLREAEQQKIQHEYLEAVESQKAGEPWRIRYATDPCPYCGHYKVRSAKWEDKQLSVAFWGVASGKLGKSFKCEHCGKMW